MEPPFAFAEEWQNFQLLGDGATARVYRAERRDDRFPVALKVVDLHALESPDALVRVLRESEILRSLNHGSIVKLYRTIRRERELILELECVDGVNLREWLKRAPTLPEARLWILANLAGALAVAHDQGIVHRDIKPENILISDEGDVKLTDFGLAKRSRIDTPFTLAGSLLGSLAYAAPECLAGKGGTISAEIFSFAVVALELLNGEHPFPHREAESLFAAWKRDPERVDLSLSHSILEPLRTLLRQSLHLNPNQRPYSLWTSYGAILSAIHAEKISERECRELLRKAPSPEVLAELRVRKHTSLSQAVRQALETQSGNSAAILPKINAFASLFPQSPEIAGFLESLRKATETRRKPRRRKLAAFFILPAILGFLGIFLLRRGTDFPATAGPSDRSIPLLPPPLKSEKAATELTATRVNVSPIAARSRATHTSRLRNPSPTTPVKGWLELITHSDVRVFIDGSRYGQKELGHLVLPTGEHRLLLEREGFLPIERNFQIRESAGTKIHTDEAEAEDESP